jgi:hypothetical protein
MALYTRANDFPGPLPARLISSTGEYVYPGPDGYAGADIVDAGYFQVQDPPAIGPHETLSWDGSGWVLTDERTLQEAIDKCLTALSARRRTAEENFTFNGTGIYLDEGTQARIDSAISGLERSPVGTTTPWQVSPGVFQDFDLATLEAMGLAAFNHVKACFENARTISGQITAATTIAEVDAVDTEVGWP